MRASAIMQLDERHQSTGGVGITLGWLIWLISGIGVVVLAGYVLHEKSDSFRASADLLAQGRLGEFAAYVVGLSVWAIAQAGQALVQYWPLALGGASLALLVWALRKL
jgi:hypothetical protein